MAVSRRSRKKCANPRCHLSCVVLAAMRLLLNDACRRRASFIDLLLFTLTAANNGPFLFLVMPAALCLENKKGGTARGDCQHAHDLHGFFDTVWHCGV